MADALTNFTPLIGAPADLPLYQLMPILAPSAGLRRQVSRRKMKLPFYHFTIFTDCGARAGLYRQSVRRSVAILVLPLLYHLAIFYQF